MKIDILLDKIWDFLIVKKNKLKHLNTNHIKINYDKRYFTYEDIIEFDPLELIYLIQNSNIRNYKQIENFFKKIDEPPVITTEEYLFILNTITTNTMLIDYLQLNDVNEFIIPSRKQINYELGNIADDFSFVFSDLNIYQNKKCYLHISKYGVVSGFTIIGEEENYCYKPKYIKHTTCINERKILLQNINKEVLNIYDNPTTLSLFVLEFVNQNSIMLPQEYKINIIRKSNKNNYIKLFENKIDLLNGKPTYKLLINKLNQKNYKKTINVFRDIVKRLPDQQYETMVIELQKNKNNTNIIEYLKNLKIEHVCDYFFVIDIIPIAKIEGPMKTHISVIIKYNNEYSIVDVSEKGRNHFVNRADLNYHINKLKNIYSFLASKTTENILNSIFNELKEKSLNLPIIKDVVYDGFWFINNKLCIVSKNTNINHEHLLTNGIIPISRFVLTNYNKRKKQYRYFEKRIPEQYKKIIKYIIQDLIFEPKKRIIKVKTFKDANALMNTITKMSCFIKKITNTNIKKTLQGILNHKFILLVKTKEYIDIDYQEFIGTKKEYGVEYELKNTSSLYLIQESNLGDEYDLIESSVINNLIDELMYIVIDSYNQTGRIDKILKNLM